MPQTPVQQGVGTIDDRARKGGHPRPPPSIPPRERREVARRLLQRARRYKGLIAIALITMILSGISQSAPIVLAKIFVGQVLQDAPAAEARSAFDQVIQESGSWLVAAAGGDATDPRIAVLWLVAAAILVTALLGAVATYANEYLAKYLASLVVKDLRVELMERVLHLPMAAFTKRKMGDLVSRFTTDAQGTFRSLNLIISEVLLQPVILVFAIGVALIINWRLGLLVFVLFPLVVLPVQQLARKVHKRAKRTLVTMGEVTESLTQVLAGLRVVKAFRMQDEELHGYERANDRWLRQQVSLVQAKALSRGLMEVVYGLTIAGLLAVGGYLVIEGRWGLSSGDFAAMLVALASIYRPLKRLTVAWHHWQESTAAASRVFEVIDIPVEAPDLPDAVAIGAIRDRITFEGVSFSYDEGGDAGPVVLHDLSFEMPAGSTVALVGPSGSGKSTIADLLFRFYEPTSGRILVDGVPLDRITRQSLLDQVAVVSQEPFLFNATIRDNIAYGRRNATDGEVEEAARAAYVHDVIEALPSGYATVVGERGASLSGGQLQRITIARAILKDASFLLLDEATSNLDSDSERAVQAALGNLLSGKTALVIAHRLSTISHADRILVLRDGAIDSQGTHQELMEKGGLYRSLYLMQTGDPDLVR